MKITILERFIEAINNLTQATKEGNREVAEAIRENTDALERIADIVQTGGENS